VPARRSTTAVEALVKHWAGILVSEGDGVYWQGVHARPPPCPADSPGTGAGGAQGARAGRVWAPGAGGAAAVAPLGPGAADRWRWTNLVCTAGPAAGPTSRPAGGGGDVRPDTGAGAGVPVDVGGGSWSRRHAESRGEGSAVRRALAQAHAGDLPRDG
jgi:hypothetical protein